MNMIYDPLTTPAPPNSPVMGPMKANIDDVPEFWLSNANAAIVWLKTSASDMLKIYTHESFGTGDYSIEKICCCNIIGAISPIDVALSGVELCHFALSDNKLLEKYFEDISRLKYYSDALIDSLVSL